MNTHPMTFTVGPVLYHWPRQTLTQFYADIADSRFGQREWRVLVSHQWPYGVGLRSGDSHGLYHNVRTQYQSAARQRWSHLRH